MRFNIAHRTHYQYSRPVLLGQQTLRFHPRDDGAQQVINYQLRVAPTPFGRNDHLDIEGNRVTKIWFDADVDYFEIALTMEVRTLRTNAFDFILAPEALTLPIHPVDPGPCAQAYLERDRPDDQVTAFAVELALSVERDSLKFLDKLNRFLFDDFDHVHRETGEPQSPLRTLTSRSGACRDLAVLFVDCCRAEGIPARFASGYQRGNLQSERRDLHAWPEVFLPGAGWRAYDPTHGIAIADTHVTIAAAARPGDTMPVSGVFTGKDVTSTLSHQVAIQVADG